MWIIRRHSSMSLRLGLAVLLLPVLLTAPIDEARAQFGNWTTRDQLPVSGRMGLGLAALDSKLYAVGGETIFASEMADVDSYNPATDGWSTSPVDLNIERTFPAVVAYNGTLFAFGGREHNTVLTSVESWTPPAAAWVARAPMPGGRWAAAACVLGSKIYVAGGYSGPSDGAPKGEVYIYDPVLDTWSNGPSLNSDRAEFGLVEAGGNLYAIGGNSAERSVEILQPGAIDWVAGPQLNENRRGVTAYAHGHKIVAVGGRTMFDTAHGSSELLTVGGTAWLTMSIHLADERSNHAMAGLNDVMYVVGGLAGDGNNRLRSVEASTVTVGVDPLPRPSGALELAPPRPNPAWARATIGLRLPVSEPVLLEILDQSGRRRSTKVRHDLAAGEHRLELPGVSRLEAGVYLVRVTQAGAARTTRLCVIR